MNTPDLVSAVTPIHSLFQRVAAPPMESVGLTPERLAFTYEVSKQRDPKFRELVRRLLTVEDTFDFDSPLVVAVYREAKLNEYDELDFSHWVVQFQVNMGSRSSEQVKNLVYAQAEAILFELESLLFD